MRHLVVLGTALLAAPAQADPGGAELAAAREAESRGAEIYAYDQAAWHSTDRFQDDLKKRKWSLETNRSLWEVDRGKVTFKQVMQEQP